MSPDGVATDFRHAWNWFGFMKFPFGSDRGKVGREERPHPVH
jgi:hypothetical protein